MKLSLGYFHFARRYSGNVVLRRFFSIPPGTEMFYFPGFAPPLARTVSVLQRSFLIRKSPGQRLLSTSPKLIAATLRPSSPIGVKASTIRPWFLIRKPMHHNFLQAVSNAAWTFFSTGFIPPKFRQRFYTPAFTPCSMTLSCDLA
jgi:hypothetical protein